MRPDKTLILTGWTKPYYLAAAAAAWRGLQNQQVREVEVAGVSMDALARVLAERGPHFARVVVLGVGLKRHHEDLVKSLTALRKDGVRTSWLSTLPMPDEFSGEAARVDAAHPAGFDEVVVKPEETTLVDVVAEVLGGLSKMEVGHFCAFAIETSDKETLAAKYQMLARAAGYLHRTSKDDELYTEVIRCLRDDVPQAMWPQKFTKAIADYVQYGRRELLGKSARMENVRQLIQQAAKYERARVLILGASGTGKETVAQQIHMQSRRDGQPFVAFNCAAVTASLVEDRLFGHEKGGFTGATEQTRGLFERADHGTLFLDEIGELSFEMQAMLLRVLEEGTFLRVGGSEEVRVDVRLIVATNRNLRAMVREGKFRMDLYQRLSTLVIEVPPLVEHKEDVRDIAYSWWYDMTGRSLDRHQLNALMDYDYPGNVRELINLLDRALALEKTDFAALLAEHKMLCRELHAPGELQSAWPDNLDEVIRRHAHNVFTKYDGNYTKAAEKLGVSVNTLKRYLKPD